MVRVSESPGLGLRDRLEDLGLPAGRVLLDALGAVDAAQIGLVLRLDPDLADEVVGEVPVLLERRELLAGDGPRVAEDLRHQWAVGVRPPGLDGDLDPGQVEAGLGDQAGGALVHVRRDPDEIERRARVPVDRGVDVIRRHAEERGESVDDRRPLVERQVRRAQLDDERGDVRDEGAAVSVVDQAARRGDRLQGRSISRREGGEAAAVDDLEIEQARREAGDRDDDREGEDEETGDAADWLRAFVVERAHQSSRSVSARRSWIEIASGPINAARIVS